jgi:hypothetical protein
MADTIQKLTPDRDLQCFFFQPSAVAALSSASATGFTVSGSFRQQFDWAVIEWNRDNTHEHPAFRNLPDGDLSGLALTYNETRTNCIAMDSDLFATVDWPSLRVWATPTGGIETIYWVPLKSHATAVTGSYVCASADFTLSGSTAAGDFVGLAFFAEQYTHTLASGDTLATIITSLVAQIRSSSAVLWADAIGSDTIRVYYTAGGSTSGSTTGANGNRFGMYTFSTGAETWDAASKTFSGGTSPTTWQVSLDFSSLQGTLTPDLAGTLVSIPTDSVRKLRWTYAADLQTGAFVRSEFAVEVSDWIVTGTNRGYSIAGPGSRRIEDHMVQMAYGGTWTESRGNFSGGTIHHSTATSSSVTCAYQSGQSHTLYLGTRYTGSGATLSISVDGGAAQRLNLSIPGEDALIRWPAGTFGAGAHTLVATHAGPSGTDFYFDFIEIASPASDLPTFAAQPKLTLATDWDTEHSLAIAPERTAWMIQSLGFTGRQNHYVGALWFYELVRTGHSYAAATVTFTGTPAFGSSVTLVLARVGVSRSAITLTKLAHMGMTADVVARAFANELNRGYTGVWASAAGAVMTIQSRSMGLDGNSNTLSASTTSGGFTAAVSGSAFTGGVNGDWRTDLTASPKLNRAVRDWSASFFTALHGYGIDNVAAFSMELGNGDPAASVGIAQVGPSGDPILLPTPSLQTNFSPTSLSFWQECYAEMAGIQAAAALQPFLQFGEVQWWYFPTDGAGHAYSGMPFYDAWTQSQFLAAFGTAMATITTNTGSPASYPNEVVFLPRVIGDFTNAIMAFVRVSEAACRFEVLYPTDTNQSAFNRAINFPVSAWTPGALDVLKTESFGFTFGRDLVGAESTMEFGTSLGFRASQRSQLVGAGDSTAAWIKEVQSAQGKGFESVVVFALDQFCLIGYELPLTRGLRRGLRMG